jgi:hypothetical protein
LREAGSRLAPKKQGEAAIKGRGRGHIPKRILEGIEEPIFDALPQRVLDNLRHPASENALVWNLLYPLAKPHMSMEALLTLRPLWGTPSLEIEDDSLRPYFWGYGISGQLLPGLEKALQRINGPGPSTEVDVFLEGERNLVLVEAKNRGGMGRCSRYQKGRCPEVRQDDETGTESCRYWESPGALFSENLEIGPRPVPDSPIPACSVHYQLARTLLVGRALTTQNSKRLHLWMIIPRRRWGSLQRTWKDFSDRILDDGLWRRLRVLAWEDVQGLR